MGVQVCHPLGTVESHEDRPAQGGKVYVGSFEHVRQRPARQKLGDDHVPATNAAALWSEFTLRFAPKPEYTECFNFNLCGGVVFYMIRRGTRLKTG